MTIQRLARNTAALMACAIGLAALPAQASVTYTYTGALLVHTPGPLGIPSVFGTRVTGSAVFDDVVSTTFSGFVDSGFTALLGTNSLGQQSASGYFEFLNGSIVDFTLRGPLFYPVGSAMVPLISDANGDKLLPYSGSQLIGSASSRGPGTWQRESAPAAVPLPATLPLLMAGVGLLGMTRRRSR
jgi:hypothetical protein